MKNATTCFPCLEDPQRCYIVSVPNENNDFDYGSKSYALSCNRKGELCASTKRGRWEEWCLIAEDADAGVYRLVNAAHKMQLTCRRRGRRRRLVLGTTTDDDDKEDAHDVVDDDDDDGEDEMILSCQKMNLIPDNDTDVSASFGHAGLEDETTSDYADDCWFLERSTAVSGTWFGIGKLEGGGMLGSNDPNDGAVKLRSFTANAYLACGSSKNGKTQHVTIMHQHDDTTTIESTATSTSTATATITNCSMNWRLDFFTGELCYLQLASTPKLLLCDNMGRIRLSQVWGGWEVWRITEAGGGDRVRISSWTHHTFFLACNPRGKIRTTTQRDNDETLWRIRKAPPGLDGVLITSVPYGRLLQSNGTTISSAGYVDGVATVWQLTAGHCQRYTISHLGYNRRLSLLQGGRQLATTRNRRGCEVWELEPVENGFVLIRSCRWKHCLQYTAHDGLGVSSETTTTSNNNPQQEQQQPWDRSCLWRVVESPTGNGFCFVSAMEPFLALSCNPKGQLEAVDHQGPWECWQLEPSMPTSLQGWQINLMIGGAVGVAIAGPALACCVVGAAAAETTTTAVAAAGTMAVAETAAAAVAAGEVASTTAAAATVGLGLAGTAAAIGTGAALGLSATGLVVAISSRRARPGGTEVKRPLGEENRPFCDWRSWQ